MRKAFEHLVVFLLICAPSSSVAQHPPVFDKLNTALRRHCAVCSHRLPAYYDSALLRFINDTAVEPFHKSHVALQAGRFESAYRYAQRTLAALNDSIQHPLYPSALFLWAKTNGEKGLASLAIRQYEQFLTLRNSDSVLRSDAYASLADLYVQQGDWEKAEPFLTMWQRYYKPFADSKTLTDLFNHIATGFANQPVHQPEVAIRMGIALFTNQKDTIRLVQFYYNIAQWYTQQSKENAKTYLNQGLILALAQRAKDYGILKKFYRALYLLEKDKAGYNIALRYQKAYEAVADSLYQNGPTPEAFYDKKKSCCNSYKAVPFHQRRKLLSMS